MQSSDSRDHVERRRHVRTPARGSVLLRSADETIRGRLLNINVEGIEVACGQVRSEDTLAGVFEVGLRFDGRTGSWLHSPGRLLHVRAPRSSVVVRFDPMSPELEAATLALARRSDGAQAAMVMIVDRDHFRCRSIALAFRARGCVVVEVVSPLDAFDWLASGHADLALILVGTTSPRSIGEELEAYLTLAHPESLILRLEGAVHMDDVLALVQHRTRGRT